MPNQKCSKRRKYERAIVNIESALDLLKTMKAKGLPEKLHEDIRVAKELMSESIEFLKDARPAQYRLEPDLSVRMQTKPKWRQGINLKRPYPN